MPYCHSEEARSISTGDASILSRHYILSLWFKFFNFRRTMRIEHFAREFFMLFEVSFATRQATEETYKHIFLPLSLSLFNLNKISFIVVLNVIKILGRLQLESVCVCAIRIVWKENSVTFQRKGNAHVHTIRKWTKQCSIIQSIVVHVLSVSN